MNENHHKSDQRSVLLTVESASISTTSVEIAVAIAASLQSSLHGLFIENEDLLRVAGLPFTREISFTTAEERPTDSDIMQRSLQSMASSFKKSIKQAAGLSNIPWSFDYVSSSLQKDAALSREEFSFTVVGHSVTARRYTGIHRPVRRILLIENHSPNLIHALKVVLQRFSQGSVEVTVIATGQKGLPESHDLQQYLDRIKTHISLVELKRENLSQLLENSASYYDCAIVPVIEDDAIRRELFDKLRCPLILVS